MAVFKGSSLMVNERLSYLLLFLHTSPLLQQSHYYINPKPKGGSSGRKRISLTVIRTWLRRAGSRIALAKRRSLKGFIGIPVHRVSKRRQVIQDLLHTSATNESLTRCRIPFCDVISSQQLIVSSLMSVTVIS